jgi:hypothetical protein
MNCKHLTDTDFQNYILEGKTDELTTKHLNECDSCKAQLEIYVLLERELRNLKPEAFSFNVSEMVLQKIEAIHKGERYFNYVFYSLVIIGISLISYLGLSVIIPFLKSIRVPNIISASMIASVALGVIFFFVSDMLRIQREKELQLFK